MIVIPTYNERACLEKLLRRLKRHKKLFREGLGSIVIVDDTSPDGTAEAAAAFAHRFPYIHVLSGPKKGLGVAYVRGFLFALYELHADVIIQMDADGSHDTKYLPALIQEINRGHDLVVGSRYIPGGALPGDWSMLRVLNSRVANLVARYVGGITAVSDCTSGFRAWNAHFLKLLPLEDLKVSGYSFQISLLAEAIKQQARITEVPIRFQPRFSGESKMRLYDITEFIWYATRLGFARFPRFGFNKATVQTKTPYSFIGIATVGASFWYALESQIGNLVTLGLGLFLLLSIAMILQNIFTLWGMIFSWNNPEKISEHTSPDWFAAPSLSFTALLPALREENVIAETIRTVDAIDYPDSLKEIVVICRADDTATIKAVETTIAALEKTSIRLVVPPYHPKNKPDKLNFGLEFSHNDVVCVFDAEDNPHPDIYSIVNTIMIKKEADVVQSGVQLMNFRSHWFATLNVLEYYFWFKSVLHFFADKGAVLLGGNTVFFKRHWLERVGGWDPECLTEDADIGIRLCAAGAKIHIIYDELHATKEETPADTMSFIRQRTRWNQGFLQVLKKHDWRELPTLSQRLLVRYILLWPEIQVFIFFYSLGAIVMMFTLKLPIILTLISFVPLYLLILYVILLTVGLYEFTQKYRLRFPRWMPLKVLLTFLPFQFLLGWSAVRAVFRENLHKNSWEKTAHINAHRVATVPDITMSAPSTKSVVSSFKDNVYKHT